MDTLRGMFRRKKPMTKRERTKKVKEARSARMKSINEGRRARKEARAAADAGKSIALDHATGGLYSKARFSFHLGKSLSHVLERGSQEKIAKKAVKALRKDKKRRSHE